MCGAPVESPNLPTPRQRMLPLGFTVCLVLLFAPFSPTSILITQPLFALIPLLTLYTAAYLSSSLWAPLQELDLNPYDVRKKCGKEDGPLCYKQMEWIDEWMNLSAVQAELGVQKGRTFRSKCSVASPTLAI